MTAPEPSDPGQPPIDEPVVGAGGDPLVLAERRARRAELAEQQARERLADAEARVAELEHATGEVHELRERLGARARRDAELAGVVSQAAAATRAARDALDREIAAREAAEVALLAERAAREASEQAVVAERAARDALAGALVAERARSAQAAALAAGSPLHALQHPPQAAVAPEPPAPAPSPPPGTAPGDTDALIAGLALAADRLRAQMPDPGAAHGGEQAPPPAYGAPAPPSRPADAWGGPARTRRGGLLRALERALRGRP